MAQLSRRVAWPIQVMRDDLRWLVRRGEVICDNNLYRLNENFSLYSFSEPDLANRADAERGSASQENQEDARSEETSLRVD